MENNKGIIYMHTNMHNGKSYIGQTIKSIEKRFNDHVREAKRNSNKDTHFHKALNKYDKSVWISEVLHSNIPINKLDIVECMCIAQYDTYYTGYNMTLGGNSGKGQIVSEETRQKLSKAGIGRKVSEDTRKKLSISNKGKKNRLGHTNSKEHREKISKSRLGVNNPGFRPWAVTLPDGTRIVVKDRTKKEFAEQNNLDSKKFCRRFGADLVDKKVKQGPLKGYIMENIETC